MDEWVEELESSGNQADKILAEWVAQQKERFLDLSESLPTLEESLNTSKTFSASLRHNNKNNSKTLSQNNEQNL